MLFTRFQDVAYGDVDIRDKWEGARKMRTMMGSTKTALGILSLCLLSQYEQFR